MIKKADTKKSLLHLYSEIKVELDTVYITSAGGRYLEEMDAISAETQIRKTKKAKEKRRKRMTDMVDILMNILKENNWGIFYKSKPMQTLSLQDDTPLLRINEVDNESIEDAVLNFIKQLKLKDLKNWATKEIEDTTPPSPTDSKKTND